MAPRLANFALASLFILVIGPCCIEAGAAFQLRDPALLPEPWITPRLNSTLRPRQSGCGSRLQSTTLCGCIPLGATCCDSTGYCATGATCVPDGCQNCPTTTCSSCANLQTSFSHCGRCENSCNTGHPNSWNYCSGGVCGHECFPNAAFCGSRCEYLNSDSNCGACGNKCNSPLTCIGGSCSCSFGQSNCGTSSNPRCEDLTSDATNCGACGRSCSPGKYVRRSFRGFGFN